MFTPLGKMRFADARNCKSYKYAYPLGNCSWMPSWLFGRSTYSSASSRTAYNDDWTIHHCLIMFWLVLVFRNPLIFSIGSKNRLFSHTSLQPCCPLRSCPLINYNTFIVSIMARGFNARQSTSESLLLLILTSFQSLFVHSGFVILITATTHCHDATGIAHTSNIIV